jgi:hypothetical protein
MFDPEHLITSYTLCIECLRETGCSLDPFIPLVNYLGSGLACNKNPPLFSNHTWDVYLAHVLPVGQSKCAAHMSGRPLSAVRLLHPHLVTGGALDLQDSKGVGLYPWCCSVCSAFVPCTDVCPWRACAPSGLGHHEPTP